MKNKKTATPSIASRALTSPIVWGVTSIAFIAAWACFYIVQDQAIYIEQWEVLVNGLFNPTIPLAQKSFLMGFSCLFIAISISATNMVKRIGLVLTLRFVKKRRKPSGY